MARESLFACMPVVAALAAAALAPDPASAHPGNSPHFHPHRFGWEHYLVFGVLVLIGLRVLARPRRAWRAMRRLFF